MDSRISRGGSSAFAIALRAACIGGLAFLAIRLFYSTHLYATAILLLGVAILVATDMGNVIARIARASERDFERLAGEGGDLPLPPAAFASHSARPVDRVAAILNAARSERQQQLELLQTLLDTVAAALFIVGPGREFVLVNRAARSLATESVLRFDDIPSLGPLVSQRLLALVPGGREIVTLPDGQRMLVSVSRFAGPDRAPRRLISIQRIAGELDAVELQAWQDMAKVLSHEMMNSLTPIASLSESLEGLLKNVRAAGAAEPIGSDVADAVEVIKRRSRGLIDFVERYRAVAELPSPRLQRVRLDELFGDIEKLLAPTYSARRVVCRSSVEPQAATLSADPQLLEQAVINLLRNASDAVSGVDDARIDISCRVAEGTATIEISDNGCGIPEGHRDQVFVPFFTTKPGGSGVGLNLARQIALAHGGGLALRANEPRGCVFTLTLPSRA